MTALVGQVLLIASNLRDRLERALEANLDSEVRKTLEVAKGDADTLIEVAQRAAPVGNAQTRQGRKVMISVRRLWRPS